MRLSELLMQGESQENQQQGASSGTPWLQRLSLQANPPVKTVEELLQRDNLQLSAQLHCSYEDLIEFKKFVIQQLLVTTAPLSHPWTEELGFSSAIPSSNVPSPGALPTGVPSLDALFFSSGLPRGQTSCLLGAANAGKSQICMAATVKAAIDGFTALYIDSHCHLSLRRLQSIISMNLLEEQLTLSLAVTQEQHLERIASILSRIHIVKIHDIWTAFTLLDSLSQDCKNASDSSNSRVNYDLIVIDSLYHWISPLLNDMQKDRVPDSNNKFITNAQPLISHLLLAVRRLSCCRPDCSILVTNSVISKELLQQLTRSTSSIDGSGSKLLNNSTISSRVEGVVPVGGVPSSLDLFDNVILITNRSTFTLPSEATGSVPNMLSELSDTIIEAAVLVRPPYCKQLPDKALIKLPYCS